MIKKKSTQPGYIFIYLKHNIQVPDSLAHGKVGSIQHYIEVIEVVIAQKLDLHLHMQSVSITTKVVSLNPAHGEMYFIQHYVIKFVSDLRQVGGFLKVLLFPPPITHHHDVTEILLKVVLNTITLTLNEIDNEDYVTHFLAT